MGDPCLHLLLPFICFLIEHLQTFDPILTTNDHSNEVRLVVRHFNDLPTIVEAISQHEYIFSNVVYYLTFLIPEFVF